MAQQLSGRAGGHRAAHKPRSSGCSSHTRMHPTGGPHLGMTVLTAGLWLPVWAVLTAMGRARARREVAARADGAVSSAT